MGCEAPVVVLGRGTVSYERGTQVRLTLTYCFMRNEDVMIARSDGTSRYVLIHFGNVIS